MSNPVPVKNICYYQQSSSADYYLKGGEPPGEFFGELVQEFGLGSSVNDKQFNNLMRGFCPKGKTKLCQNAGSDNRVPAYDIVYSPHKSISIIWSCSELDERVAIQAANNSAVKAALRFLEEHASFSRRGHNGASLEKLSGFLIGMYEHSTSREQDMHLHIHSVIMNLANRDDGTWGAIVGRFLYTWSAAADAVYQSQLAKQMASLGYSLKVSENGKAFEVLGVPKSISKHFSKRSMQIEKNMERYGSSNRASKLGDKIARSTRKTKEKVDRPALFSSWQRELAEQGFDNSNIKSNERKLIETANPDEKFCVESLLQVLVESKSVFRECDLYTEASLLALRTGYSAYQAQLLVQKTFENKELVKLEVDKGQNILFSTKEVIAAEQEMISLAKQLSSSNFQYSILDHALVEAFDAQPFALTYEQREAAYKVCSPSCLSIVQGSAGAGKTTLMKVVVDVYEKLGSKVVGAANTKAAAFNLEKQASVEGCTICLLLKLLGSNKPPLKRGDVLILDEAGQIGTFQMLELMRYAKRMEFKLLMVGEDKQLDAIQHGGVLKYLSSPNVIGTTKIETIKRQRQDWDRQSVANFRDGLADKALAQYVKRNQVHIGRDHDETLALLVDAWKEFIKKNSGKECLMLAKRWAVVNELNEAARLHLKSLDKLGKEDISVSGIVSKHAVEFKVSIGERLRLTKNDYAKNLTNGHTGTVIEVKRNLDDEVVLLIKLDIGRTVKIRASEYCDEKGRLYLIPAYARTVYASQGITVNGETFVYYDSSMDRANTYVACSRHKEKATIFGNASDLEEYVPLSYQNEPNKPLKLLTAMAACMSRESSPKLASEYLKSEDLVRCKSEALNHNYIHSLI
ncbi:MULTISPECIES: MobF family relaxase [unclassified Pseudoalteromonas]|uniref:MobF family relaxase n=1 Tax=unclassified Pseudoalteromonas TaxID=194690 RepID=UPI001108E855|nr:MULTISPECIES: MobF family relaxase [unclassified Pseudoalteromonas]TMN81763.1 hypothetical protein CWB64_10570 [Pseudoalteromonas sp. S410]TMN91925.1 hypothetical protein CWB62_04335 [Pseudoalteromonas sp. S408]TMN96213.1 hypothetical protein CWB63_16770 [Pseudoalteromonas sp. S409]TMN98419.1 hypothetical protein CWB61_07010 [Pseudoalteromonas sp. S407]TMO09625.1 hypothetical protein CWB57_11595 [Pseudoalteromonas sp. S186]